MRSDGCSCHGLLGYGGHSLKNTDTTCVHRLQNQAYTHNLYVDTGYTQCKYFVSVPIRVPVDIQTHSLDRS